MEGGAQGRDKILRGELAQAWEILDIPGKFRVGKR